MPKVSQNIIDSVFFLYATKKDALNGDNPSGTGFVVSYISHTDQFTQFYGVTNWHVACIDGLSIVRMNTIDDRIDVMEFESDEWYFVQSGPVWHDPLELNTAIHAVNTVRIDSFARKHDPHDLQSAMI